MTAQDIILGTRVEHIRELKTQVSALKAENDRLRKENEELREHFELALTATRDLETLPADGTFVVVDGWNFILGARRTARDPAQLLEHVEKYLAERPHDFAWVIFDGPRAATTTTPRLRVSYTGGTGTQRADRFICDFVRMASFRGLAKRISVKTRDKMLRRAVERLTSREGS